MSEEVDAEEASSPNVEPVKKFTPAERIEELNNIPSGPEDATSFHNLSNGNEVPMTSGPANACGVTENSNWWNYKTGFNGTAGIGRGPIASRPDTCTTGVGYWATDQGSWNTKLPANTSGSLYKCTAPNTWTLYYTPYTYPHPLRTGSPSSSSIMPPSNLTAAVQ